MKPEIDALLERISCWVFAAFLVCFAALFVVYAIRSGDLVCGSFIFALVIAFWAISEHKERINNERA
jgi:ABC-type transport system involved in multi-copper enzyme maturation permease subunit